MERLVCYCVKCKSELARFTNSWDAIGTNYHSPIQPPISVTGLEATGLTYGAAQESSIENSSLQDVACIECRSTLGLQCYSAPLGHVLKKNQLILNLSLMSVISESTRKNATIVVRKSIALTKSKAPSGAHRASSVHSLPRGQPRSVRASRPPVPLFHANANTPKIPAAGNRSSVPPLTASLRPSETERLGSWTETNTQNQQKDIDRVSEIVGRVERDMQSFKEFMEEVRSGLTSCRENLVQAKDDINKIRMQAEEIAQRPRSRDGFDVFSKRLDAITDDILLVNQKASKFDQLQEELRKMQDRLASLEGKAAPQDFPGHTLPQAQARVPAMPQKRQHDEIVSLRTPSSNARSPPKHPSKRTRFSDINMEDIDQNYEPSVESHLSVATPLRKAREIAVSQQGNTSPLVVNNDDYGVPVDDGNRDVEAFLPAAISTPTAPTTSKPTRRRTSGVSIPTDPMEVLNSSPRQLRNRTIANKPNLTVTHDMQTLSGKRRNSEGVLISMDGTTSKRSLRKRQSAAALGCKAPTEWIVLPITETTRSSNQSNGADKVVASVEVIRASHRAPPRPASLASREVALVERERLVRQTLEREMRDVRR